MKKIFVLLIIVAAVIFAACSTHNIADDGTNLRDWGSTNTSGGGGGSFGGGGSIGNEWGALFVNHGHSPLDIQIWQDTATVSPNNTDCLTITASSVGWVGVLFVQKSDSDGSKPTDVHYDMSKVAKMKFKAKASKNITASIIYTKGSSFADADDKPKNANITTDWKEFTFERAGSEKAFSILAVIAEGVSSGDTIQIKDVDYLDSNGKSVAIKYAQ